MFLSRVDASALPRSAGRRRPGRLLPMLGPAFVAAIAYVDPGNVATNSTAGASFGYTLLWVVVAANVLAVLVQTLTAKLGMATGRDLATHCRLELPRPVVRGLWVQAEVVAIATDLAEIVGGAVALHLLFGVPLPVGGLLTAAVACALLGLQRHGHRPFERVVTGCLLVIAVGFGYTLVGAGVDPQAGLTGLAPSPLDGHALVLAIGILGATVMPHVVYVHSALTPGRYGDTVTAGRTRAGRARLLRAQRWDVGLAMLLAGAVNAALLIAAAGLFAGTGQTEQTLESVHAGLGAHSGRLAATAFAVALLASGFAASSVGTHAGQVVMAGFLRRRVPLLLRRTITVAPAVGLLAVGADPTAALVWSQVVLSFGIPFALVPLVWLTARRSVMGPWVNRWTTTAAACAVTAVVTGLNGWLVLDLLG
ncbi:MAG: mntH [Klenkia sp.]|nr:mntH [Klenkia sp.]